MGPSHKQGHRKWGMAIHEYIGVQGGYTATYKDIGAQDVGHRRGGMAIHECIGIQGGAQPYVRL